MKITKEKVKVALISTVLLMWPFLFPPLVEHFYADEPGSVGPQPYMLFMPLVYILLAFPFLMGCYYLYDLIKGCRPKY
jgi:hypothetical protein